MINTQDVIEYFDRLAPQWDADMISNEAVIEKILDIAGVSAGKTVLDVACGTGVMIPYYLKRNAASVTGIDISPKMTEIARAKFSVTEPVQDGYPTSGSAQDGSYLPNVEIICGDAEKTEYGKRFDCIVVYNAFPHFPDPERVIKSLSKWLAPGGTLTVAHGMSRDKIDAHHQGAAMKVSNGLMSAEELAEIFSKYLKVTAVISDSEMYQVAGKLII